MYAGAIFSPTNTYQQNTYTTPSGTALTPLTLGTLAPQSGSPAGAAGPAASLIAGGITNLVQMSSAYASNGGPTYGAYGPNAPPPNLVAVTAASKVIYADPIYIYGKLYVQPVADSNNVPCRYVVFGLGPYCTMIGSRSFGLFDAPISFGEHAFEAPTQAYARMLCVFRVYDDGSRCEFIGSAHPDATGLGTFDMHLQEYYQTNNGTAPTVTTGS
jgi:hypothetical protein